MSARYLPSTSSSQASESTLRSSSPYHIKQQVPRVSDSQGSQVPPTLLQSSSPYISPYAPLPPQTDKLPLVPVLRTQNSPSPRQSLSIAESSAGLSDLADRTRSATLSTYSSSSQDCTLYRGISPSRSSSIASTSMNSSRKISQVSQPFTAEIHNHSASSPLILMPYTV